MEEIVTAASTSSVDIKPQQFVCVPSLSRQATPCDSPLDFFQLFVTSALVHTIVEATNKMGSSLYKEKWANTTASEINRLIAAVICMGVTPHPTIDSYWHHDLRSPFITKLFPQRDRFRRLYRAFYLSTGAKNSLDPLWHIRLLITHFEVSFPAHFSPSQVLVVDESMVPCKARSTLKQYMKNKPHRWGYKIWCLVADGYLLRFAVYTGRRREQSLRTPTQVVQSLVAPYYGFHHLVVMNNFYSSFPLFRILLSHSTYALGTIRSNRKEFPKDLVGETENFERGQSSHRQIGGLVAYSFYDRKPVYLISSFHPPSQKSTIDRRDPSGQVMSISVPTAVKDYNSYRGGVDNVDQRMAYYSIPRKSRRWWPRLAWWLIDAAISNAHRLYQMQINPTCNGLDFRMKLMHELAGDICSDRSEEHNKRQCMHSTSTDTHRLSQSDNLHDCSICSRQPMRRKRTHFMCSPCHVYLCCPPCYDTHRLADE